MLYEEATLGKRNLAAEYNGFVHTLGQFALVQCECLASFRGSNLLVVAHCAAVQYTEGILLALCYVVLHGEVYLAAVILHSNGHTLLFNFGQCELELLAFLLFVGSGNGGAVFHTRLRRYLKATLAIVCGFGGEQRGLVGINGYLLVDECTIVSTQLICHLAFEPCNKMSALGVELQLHIGQFRTYPLAVAHKTALAVEHILEIPVVTVHFVENGEHAAENGILTPVEHISCVCTHLVVARQQQRVQLKIAPAATVLVNLVFFCLHHIAFGGNQLHIQHLAWCGYAVVCTIAYICLEPHSFS